MFVEGVGGRRLCLSRLLLVQGVLVVVGRLPLVVVVVVVVVVVAVVVVAVGRIVVVLSCWLEQAMKERPVGR